MRRELLWGWTAELDGSPRELEWNQLLGILQDLKYLLYHSPVCQCPLSRETAIRGGDEVAPEIGGTCCVHRGSRCRLWRFGWNPFQDSRIRDYQWLPCHTVSIRNPQISRTRFVVDCSAFLPALGWLVAFCAAKAWRTNAHSLRSLGTQSREDRKREKEKSRRVYGESFFRCFAQVRHSEAWQNLFRICFESVAIWRFCVLFRVFLSLRVWTRPPVLLFWLRPRVTKQFANIDQVESSLSIYQVYQVSQTSDEMWDVLSTMCHIKGFVDQISDEPPWKAMMSHDSRESLDYRLPQLDFCPWVSAINRSARVQSMEKCPCQLRGVGWWCCQIYQAAEVRWRCATRLSLNRLKSLIHIDPSSHVSSKTTQQDSWRTIKHSVQLSSNQLVFESTKVF